MSNGSPPGGYIKGAAIEAEARRLVEEWRLLAPEEYAAWPEVQRRQRESRLSEKGTSSEGSMFYVCSLPARVMFGMGRFLGTQNWTVDEPDALRIVLSVLPDAKMTSYKGTKFASDDRHRHGR